MKQILKYILLWATSVSICLFLIGGVEKLIEKNYWLVACLWLAINLLLFFVCYNTLSYKDVYRGSGCRWFDQLLKA